LSASEKEEEQESQLKVTPVTKIVWWERPKSV